MIYIYIYIYISLREADTSLLAPVRASPEEFGEGCAISNEKHFHNFHQNR